MGSEFHRRLIAQGRFGGGAAGPGCDYSKASVPTEHIADPRRIKRLQVSAILRFYLRPGVLWGLLRENMSFSQLRELVAIVRTYVLSR
jgi:hypothetical protein